MRIASPYRSILSLLQVRFGKRRIPLAVRWQLTNKCVLQCRYCSVWNTPKEELSLSQIVSILDELSALGTQTISFSGGEPMLRSDIGEILAQTKKRKISTEMNSTGAQIPERIGELEHLDFLKISLDGDEDINDAVRWEGAFKLVREAAEACRKNGRRFIFTTTLSRANLGQIDFLIETARRYDTLVAFQPLTALSGGVADLGGVSPEISEFRNAVDKLIRYKKKEPHLLRNSLAGLYHIRHWPDFPKLKCWAGRAFCVIHTDGTVAPCDRIEHKGHLLNCVDGGFARAFMGLPEVSCSGCAFCGVLELNFLLGLNLGALDSILRVLAVRRNKTRLEKHR